MAEIEQIGQTELINLELRLEALRPGAEATGGELLQAFEDLRADIDQLWDGGPVSRAALYEQARGRLEALTGRVMESVPDDTRPPEQVAISGLLRWAGMCRAVARRLPRRDRRELERAAKAVEASIKQSELALQRIRELLAWASARGEVRRGN